MYVHDLHDLSDVAKVNICLKSIQCVSNLKSLDLN